MVGKVGKARKIAVVYHESVLDFIDDWSRCCGCKSSELRRLSKRAIQLHHSEVTIRSLSDGTGDCQRQPKIYCLSLGVPQAVWIYFSLEGQQAVVRGYGWESTEENGDDGGGYYGFLNDYCPRKHWG